MKPVPPKRDAKPRRGSRATGGFSHDGRFATLRDVVDHYDGVSASP